MRISFVFMIAFLTACSSEIPKDVLPREKMQKVMWDMMLADEMILQNQLTDSSFAKIAKQSRYYQSIFKIHNTTEETFKKSVQFYMEHPALFKPILDSINSAGQRMQQDIDTTQKVADSFIKKSNIDSIRRREVH
ncbi:MAG: DUF4296 domain-containing protein [Flavisolibacter sp.]